MTTDPATHPPAPQPAAPHTDSVAPMPELPLAHLQAQVDEARAALDEAVRRRNAAIRAARQSGMSLRAVGRVIGLTSSGVRYVGLSGHDN